MNVSAKEFKNESVFDRNCLIILKLEDIILSMNYIFMQSMPLVKCYIYTAITTLWLLMMVIGSPLKSKVSFVIYVLNKLLKLRLGIITVVLTTNKSASFISADTTMLMGRP